MKRTEYPLRRLLAALMTVLLLSGAAMPAALAAQDGVLHIRTENDWNAMAKRCRLDTWSRGRTVVLEADLDLRRADPVPTFSGTLDGGGHTITGFSFTGEGSHQGLFRYICKGAVVKDLHLAAELAPTGSASVIGGIAGSNAGSIVRCTFAGCVEGTDSVGGIAGVNEGDGRITNCQILSGTVSGEHFTGGIVGENYGSVVHCSSAAKVNPQVLEPSPQLDELDWTQLNSAENLPACTDTGGIAGYSAGLLQSCTNTGTVGYPHSGYNVGGIAGRQAGQIGGCINAGTVLGRKDVGGIVGQAEPHTLRRYEEDTLQKLADNLTAMSGILSEVLTDTDGSRHLLTGDLTAINGLTGQAKDDVAALLDELELYGDSAVDVVNDLSARVSQVLDRAYPVSQSLGEAADQLAQAMGSFRDLTDDHTGGAGGGVNAAIGDVTEALEDVDSSLKAFSAGLKALWNALGDRDAMDAALDQLYSALDDFTYAMDRLSAAADTLSEAMTALPDWDEAGPLADAMDQLTQALHGMDDAAAELSAGANALRDAEDLEAVLSALAQTGSAFRHLAQAGRQVRSALDAVVKAGPQLDDLLDLAASIAKQLHQGLAGLADAAGSVNTAFDQLGTLLEEQNDLPSLEFPKLPDSFHEKEDQLGSTMGALNGRLEGLNQTLSQAGDTLSGGLRRVNDQFSAITDLLRNARKDPDRELMVDVSAENISAVTLGKVRDCRNTGSVEGDVNIGGVTGAMAIEFDFDPEDDVTDQGSSSLRYQYLTQAIVQGCTNRGSVTSRKNCVGGIVGRMDLGVALSCRSFGPVKSTAGEEAGGIAGASSALIRDCWAKCPLSAVRYVGGISGSGGDIRGCRTLVHIDDADSCFGAIAGVSDGVLAGNTFVSETLGGVDGISYQGKASPLAYADFIAQPGVPGEFTAMTLTFTADGRTVNTVELPYGKPVPEQKIPAVPEREGFYGAWSAFDRDRLLFDAQVEAEYTPWRTAIAGADGQVLAEGTFQPGTELTAVPGTDQAPKGAGGVFCASWKITAPDGVEFTALRVKLPEGCKKASFWVRTENGSWEKVPSTLVGSFLRAGVKGSAAEVCIMETVSRNMLWLAGGSVLILAAGVFLILHIRRRHRPGDPPKPPKADDQKAAVS